MRVVSIVANRVCLLFFMCLIVPGLLVASGADNAEGDSSGQPDEQETYTRWNMSLDEIAMELSNPVTALRSISLDSEYRMYQGDLPGSGDWDAWIHPIKISFPFQLNNGKNILVRATVPIYQDQPTWVVDFGHPIWEVDRDYAEWLLRQSPQITADTGQFKAGHDHLADVSFDVAYGGVSDSGFISMYGIATVLSTSQDINSSRNQTLLGPEFAFGKRSDWGVIGAWATHLTDVEGDKSFSTNETSVQVFFAYGLSHGWQIISNTTILYDWEADGGNELLLPIGAGLAKTISIGHMPMKMAFEIQNYVVSPDRFGPEWLLKISFTPVISNLFSK